MQRISRVSVPCLAAALLLRAAAATAAVEPLTLEDFKSATTDGIVKLCSAPAGDALHQAAVGYCVGYLTGAFHYYKAIEGLPGQPKLFCVGTVERSRREEIDNFVAWTTAHPEFGSSLAIDSMFRYLAQVYPCP